VFWGGYVDGGFSSTGAIIQLARYATLALTCAAVDDVTAWCVWHWRSQWLTPARSPGFPHDFVFLLHCLHGDAGALVPATSLPHTTSAAGRLSQIVLAWIYMGVVASALITELIGIHDFGAFYWSDAQECRFSPS